MQSLFVRERGRTPKKDMYVGERKGPPFVNKRKATKWLYSLGLTSHVEVKCMTSITKGRRGGKKHSSIISCGCIF
jgi:hypothetical protein